ncbi:hypothetical protein PVAND_009994 [Polypedilum vanderplanki]|uniref:C-type lectin domain-containing protein n=1 Tax=Polypedilum vanderplanki TaxID=319348 RepID=A0A9J6CFU5_POLVA|nr:hypothetical protein PVAND_009994 [Polypedilum vanderplanki]
MKFLSVLLFVVIINVITCSVSDVAFVNIGTFVFPWIFYQKTYYVPRHFVVNWMDAKSACRDFGMELASIETLLEYNAVVSFLIKNQQYFSPQYLHVNGMTKTLASKTDWYWLNSDQQVSYSMTWGFIEPQNTAGDEWCLAIGVRNQYSYADVSCVNNKQAFLCQSIPHKCKECC